MKDHVPTVANVYHPETPCLKCGSTSATTQWCRSRMGHQTTDFASQFGGL